MKLEDSFSNKICLQFQAPHGPVLGPLLFKLCKTPLSTICQGYESDPHLYSDDIQLYISFSTSESSPALLHPQKHLDTVQNWMLWNKLKHRTRSFSFLYFVSLEQPPAVYLFSHYSCYLLETSEDTSLELGPPLHRHRHAWWPVMLRNCFFKFAVEHRFSCNTTGLEFTRDIGAIEIWLLGWLHDWF